MTTITDNITLATTTDPEQVKEWFPEAPQDVLDAVDDLIHALATNAPYAGPAAYLDITVK